MPSVRREHRHDPAQLNESVDNHGCPPGCGSGRPPVNVVAVALETSFEVEQDARELDTGQAIGQAVVDHLEHCNASALESVDEPDFPQGSVVIERGRHQSGTEL